MSCFCATVSAPLSAGWLAEVERLHGKKQLLNSGGLHALRDEYTRTIAPAHAAETLSVERLPNVECGM